METHRRGHRLLLVVQPVGQPVGHRKLGNSSAEGVGLATRSLHKVITELIREFVPQTQLSILKLVGKHCTNICMFIYIIDLIESTSLMLVVVSGLVRPTSSFIQGRVYRGTDAPNMTLCRT